MLGKKAILGEIFGSSGFAALCLRMGLCADQQLRVLAYHRVLDVPNEQSHPTDPDLVSASTEAFERQMRFVIRHFRPVSFSDVVDAIEDQRPLPPRSLIVSFDDGHLDNYANAFPVLRALGIPATIFLSTAYIGTDQMYWFERVALLMYSAPSGNLQLQCMVFSVDLGDVSSRRLATAALLFKLKRVPNGQRLACLSELEGRLAYHIPEGLTPPRSALSWDEVREMSRHGIEFGSHCVTHPILTQLDDDVLLQELAESRVKIRNEIGRDLPVIAYPVGKRDAFDVRVVNAARACGYKLGISYETGVNNLSRMDHFSIRRFAVERYTSPGLFKAMLTLPRIFA